MINLDATEVNAHILNTYNNFTTFEILENVQKTSGRVQTSWSLTSSTKVPDKCFSDIEWTMLNNTEIANHTCSIRNTEKKLGILV